MVLPPPKLEPGPKFEPPELPPAPGPELEGPAIVTPLLLELELSESESDKLLALPAMLGEDKSEIPESWGEKGTPSSLEGIGPVFQDSG